MDKMINKEKKIMTRGMDKLLKADKKMEKKMASCKSKKK